MVSLIKEILQIIAKMLEALLTIAFIFPIVIVVFVFVYIYKTIYNIINNEDHS
jgi:hypothetical protein